MTKCPYCNCQFEYDDLEEVMDELSKNKRDGIHNFSAKCCGKQIHAYSENSRYFIKKYPSVEGDVPQFIGAA